MSRFSPTLRHARELFSMTRFRPGMIATMTAGALLSLLAMASPAGAKTMRLQVFHQIPYAIIKVYGITEWTLSSPPKTLQIKVRVTSGAPTEVFHPRSGSPGSRRDDGNVPVQQGPGQASPCDAVEACHRSGAQAHQGCDQLLEVGTGVRNERGLSRPARFVTGSSCDAVRSVSTSSVQELLNQDTSGVATWRDPCRAGATACAGPRACRTASCLAPVPSRP